MKKLFFSIIIVTPFLFMSCGAVTYKIQRTQSQSLHFYQYETSKKINQINEIFKYCYSNIYSLNKTDKFFLIPYYKETLKNKNETYVCIPKKYLIILIKDNKKMKQCINSLKYEILILK